MDITDLIDKLSSLDMNKLIDNLTGGAYSPEAKKLNEESKSVMPQLSDPAKMEIIRNALLGFGSGGIAGHLPSGLVGTLKITDLAAFRNAAAQKLEQEQTRAESTHTGLFDELYPIKFTKGDKALYEGKLVSITEPGRVPWVKDLTTGKEFPVSQSLLRGYDPKSFLK